MLPLLALGATLRQAQAEAQVLDTILYPLRDALEDLTEPDGLRADAQVQESYRVDASDRDGMTLTRYRREVRNTIPAREEDRTWSFRWADLRGWTVDREPGVDGAVRMDLRFIAPVKAKVKVRMRLAALPPETNYVAEISDRAFDDADSIGYSLAQLGRALNLRFEAAKDTLGRP